MSGFVVPGGHQAQIAYFQSLLPLWVANAAAIGLVPAQVVALHNAVTEAQTAFNDQQIARNAAKNSTYNATLARRTMRASGGDLIKTIRAFAETSGNPDVYALAGIPAPAPRTPLGPPETPTDFSGRVNTAGGVDLKWKSTRRGGTTFIIQRRHDSVNAQGEITSSAWSQAGVSAQRSFIDDQAPAGAVSVTYRIRALRGGGESEWSLPVTVPFGNVLPMNQAGNGAAQGGRTLSLAA